ncbi:hypothetical protein ADK82_24175 [Streptomyces sp. NRRL S-4]|nr:hypothetical protein ADK82_24175 [Streptomyces sp. NRRL S-4]
MTEASIRLRERMPLKRRFEVRSPALARAGQAPGNLRTDTPTPNLAQPPGEDAVTADLRLDLAPARFRHGLPELKSR